ncbi:MAG: CDP-alcohol phosphatidyltransferase family protein [Bacteroidales bacterium]
MGRNEQNAKWLIPSGITMMNWVAGVFSIVAASVDMYLEAALLILIAALFDLFDGLVARLIDAQSKIGAELDSLADSISFGLAPSFLMYRILLDWQFDAWMLYLVFLPGAAAVLRLAIYNVRHQNKNYFVGLAVPASALFHAGIILSIALTDHGWLHQIIASKIFWSVSCIATAVLMLVPVRMFSLKMVQFSWKGNEFTWLFIGGAVIMILIFQVIALPMVILLYIVLSFLYHITFSKNKPY